MRIVNFKTGFDLNYERNCFLNKIAKNTITMCLK